VAKAYIIGGIIAALVALWLVRGIVQAGAARQQALAAKIDAKAHKIEIRRSNPIIHKRWKDRQTVAATRNEPFAETEPIDTQVLELTPGEAIEIEPGISIILN